MGTTAGRRRLSIRASSKSPGQESLAALRAMDSSSQSYMPVCFDAGPGRRPCFDAGPGGLTASLQLEVLDEIFHMWAEKQGARWLVIIQRQGSCTSQAQVIRKLFKEYFKTHCDKVYGGFIWLQFIIAIGEVSDTAIESVNEQIDMRIHFKRFYWADRTSMAPGSHHFLRRHARASTPDARASTLDHPRHLRQDMANQCFDAATGSESLAATDRVPHAPGPPERGPGDNRST